MTTTPGLAGRRVGITADRRWEAQADLLEKLGAEIIHGPTLRTVDLSHDEALRRATVDLIAEPPDWLVASTGQGLTMWLDAADGWDLGEPLRRALRRSRAVARGAKASSALRRQGFEVAWKAPSETMEEVVEFLSGEGIGAARVALQLFDPAGHPSTEALAARCRELVAVPVYRWVMPDDTGPAARLVAALCAGAVDAVTFTSQPAVHHLFRIAEGGGRGDELRAACNGAVLPVCVGPVCARAASEEGVANPRWPDPPRLAAMIRLLSSELAGAPSRPEQGRFP